MPIGSLNRGYLKKSTATLLAAASLQIFSKCDWSLSVCCLRLYKNRALLAFVWAHKEPVQWAKPAESASLFPKVTFLPAYLCGWAEELSAGRRGAAGVHGWGRGLVERGCLFLPAVGVGKSSTKPHSRRELQVTSGSAAETFCSLSLMPQVLQGQNRYIVLYWPF